MLVEVSGRRSDRSLVKDAASKDGVVTFTEGERSPVYGTSMYDPN
jgi:hypothetical protein